jgi:hemerythrin-like domain-containing protein
MKQNAKRGKMMPIAPLMIEHRLIERMLAVARRELERFNREKRLDPAFVRELVDFIRTYADRCHHGKEEDILFRDLAAKELTPELRNITEELISEHKWARGQTRDLAEANERYAGGDDSSFVTVLARLNALSEFYPKHIEKEDKHFFLPVMRYFTEEEKQAMLGEGSEFDATLIHEKYRRVVEEAEGGAGQ